MGKKNPESLFMGLWHILSMTTWDEDSSNEEVRAWWEEAV
jgi:hypothetical protein